MRNYRAETQRWYNTKHWRARRDYQLSTEPLCAMCLKLGKYTPATVADHIVPHKGDPELFEGALQSLCAFHHNSTKQSHEANPGKGCDVNGMPFAPHEHWK